MYTTSIFIITIGFLILIHEFGHFIVAKKLGIKVEMFFLGFGPKLFSFKKNDTEYGINLIPFGGFVKMAGDTREEFQGKKFEFLAHPPIHRAAVIFFGPLLNYFLALVCFCVVFMVGYPVLTTTVGELMDNFPAKEAGILPGDEIISVAGAKVSNWDELQENIFGNKESTLNVTVIRESEELEFIIRPKQEKVKNIFGQDETVGLIGIRPEENFITIKYGFLESVVLGSKKLVKMTAFTYEALFKMITGVIPVKESVTGPLGIFFLTKQAIELGFNYLVHVAAILSMSLAIFNLLPLPILDGGHLLLLGIEKIRKKPLSPKADEWVMRIGLSFIILIAVFVFINDISKFEVTDKIINWWQGLK